MELGNIIFGNSRGNYEIDRGTGWEEELQRLFDTYAPDKDNSYGIEFENDIFSVFPYYWGDCNCGFEEQTPNINHREDCYQSLKRKELLKRGWTEGEYFDEPPKHYKYDVYKKIEDDVMSKLCKQFKLPFPSGCMVHCTCDYDLRYDEWLKKIGYPQGHKEECLLLKPNFLHKPTGFEIQWYKYPLRDSYKNQDIDLEQFREIIEDCIISCR